MYIPQFPSNWWDYNRPAKLNTTHRTYMVISGLPSPLSCQAPCFYYFLPDITKTQQEIVKQMFGHHTWLVGYIQLGRSSIVQTCI